MIYETRIATGRHHIESRSPALGEYCCKDPCRKCLPTDWPNWDLDGHMATKEMPLLLDNGLPMQLDGVGDVDDLFGDSANLPLRQPTKQIELRLDQLRSRGCCKYALPEILLFPLTPY